MNEAIVQVVFRLVEHQRGIGVEKQQVKQGRGFLAGRKLVKLAPFRRRIVGPDIEFNFRHVGKVKQPAPCPWCWLSGLSPNAQLIEAFTNNSGRKAKMARPTKRRVRREWTAQDIRDLKRHSKGKTPVAVISKVTKRTPGALRQKALVLGLPLGHRR